MERKNERGCGVRRSHSDQEEISHWSARRLGKILSCIHVHWAGLHIDISESRDLVLEAGDLSRGEVVHASVVGIVHVVLDS